MSPPSRPASADADDIAKWQEEMEAYREQKQREEDFRAQMLQFVTRTDVTLTGMREDMQQHAVDDKRQFRQLRGRVKSLGGQVTQSVNTNKYNWGVVAAWVSAFVAIASVGWALFEKFGGALKP